MPDIKLGRLHGGFCVYWWEDGRRRRYQLDARTRKEAEAEALDVYRRQTWNPNHRPTTAECIDAYIAHLGERPSATTVRYIRGHICAAFGALRPDQITERDCRVYRADREAMGKSVGTVHTELGHLRSALRYAEKAGLIGRAPHIWRPAKPAPKERFLTHDEIDRLIGATASPHIRLAIILLLGTAGRVGAILDLEWQRVDFVMGNINLRVTDSATRKGRAIVPMNGMTRAALQTAHHAALSDYVIEYAGDRVKSIRKGFTAACERAGLDDVTIHDLRRTAAVHMVSAGVDMELVSQFLGHSNSRVTASVYARYAPSALREAADVLEFLPIKRVSK